MHTSGDPEVGDRARMATEAAGEGRVTEISLTNHLHLAFMPEFALVKLASFLILLWGPGCLISCARFAHTAMDNPGVTQ